MRPVFQGSLYAIKDSNAVGGVEGDTNPPKAARLPRRLDLCIVLENRGEVAGAGNLGE